MMLEVWRRRKWLAIVTFAAVFLPALTIVLFLPDIYRATATLLVDRQQVAEAFVKSAVTGEETETRLETIKQEMLSSAVLTWLVQRFNLTPGGRTSLEEAIERTGRDIKIEVKAVDQAWGRGATVAFAVSYRGRDPATVAQVANALAGFYVDRNVKMRERRASETAELLRTQLADVGQRMGGWAGLGRGGARRPLGGACARRLAGAGYDPQGAPGRGGALAAPGRRLPGADRECAPAGAGAPGAFAHLRGQEGALRLAAQAFRGGPTGQQHGAAEGRAVPDPRPRRPA